MDPVILLCEGHRSYMLLDLSGLTREERAMIQASIGNERDFDCVAEALIIHIDEFHLQESRSYIWPEAREKERAKTKTAPCVVPASRRSRSKGKGKPTTYSEDPAICDDYDCEDDVVEFADAFQAYTDPADPGSDDGDDVQHEHDDDYDTSGSYLAVDSATATEEAERDAIALLVDTWDVDLMSDLARANSSFAHDNYHWKTGVGARTSSLPDIKTRG